MINVINVRHVMSVGDSICTVEGTTEGHTEGAGGKMVFVKVRETYDLCTVAKKMSVIAIHTPKPDILKLNYPGLLMQCRSYRPVSADVRLACASVEPMDPLGVGTAEGDVSPEDLFNPILYKAMSNFGMSQLEARINAIADPTNAAAADVDGKTATVEVDYVTAESDEFPIYYGLLSQTHEWRHANPQQGLEMNGLKPLVYEMVYNIGDNASFASNGTLTNMRPGNPDPAGSSQFRLNQYSVVGGAKPFPWLNCTSWTQTTHNAIGFTGVPDSYENDVPYLPVVCGVVIIPPCRLHQLFFRMVVEWTIEFSQIRSITDIQSFTGLGNTGGALHYQNYSYEAAKAAITGSEETILENDVCMASSNVDLKKVM